MRSNYDKYPAVAVRGVKNCAWQGADNIRSELLQAIARKGREKIVVCVDCYHGVWEDELLKELKFMLRPALVVKSEHAAKDSETIEKMIERNLTDDRVFGAMTVRNMPEFFSEEKIADVRGRIGEIKSGVVLVIGVGAALLCDPDILIYADMPRWELQQRYRSKRLGNWLCDNENEDTLRKYKRGFFVEWRVADRHKNSLFKRIDYFLDTTQKEYKMMAGDAVREGLRQTAHRPFRVVPFFDPGVWGGQWMKKVCNLPREEKNYAWCFDCVPEENSLMLQADGVTIEIPSINLVFQQPIALLGDKVHARFGAEFPIRFDFLDTMEGQNLSLQVHPLTEYIQNTFGMHYTQDESYYILDANDDAKVYLGVKNGVDPDEMVSALKEAQTTAQFDDKKYVNCFPAKKHDHFLIPAGTVHCSGANTMVLEISATPFIFTFKLWDWNRLGLDGKPRPVHIAHGEKNIQFSRNTDWVKKNLINRVEVLEEGDGYREERTGLHEREFIETRRLWFEKPVCRDTEDGVQVLNLVEGSEATVRSPSGAFEPFRVHYAETFIIPASVGKFELVPENGERCGVIRAYVRT